MVCCDLNNLFTAELAESAEGKHIFIEIELRSIATSLVDPQGVDKCLLAFGEFDAGRSTCPLLKRGNADELEVALSP